MKQKTKLLYKIAAVVVGVLIICLVLLIPPVKKKAAEAIGWTQDKLQMVVATVAGICLSILLVIFGVAVAATLPLLATGLILAGVGVLAWNLWPLLQTKNSVSDGSNQASN